jgi:hypothetical protein
LLDGRGSRQHGHRQGMAETHLIAGERGKVGQEGAEAVRRLAVFGFAGARLGVGGSRLDWRRFPELVARNRIPPPQIATLPALAPNPTDGQKPAISWQLSPELTRRRRSLHAGNGFA